MARIIKADNTEDARDGQSAVLRLTDFADQARALVLEARTEAGRIVAEARSKAEAALQEANHRGYEEGFARGQNDGYADGHRQGVEEAIKDTHLGNQELAAFAKKIFDELSAAREQIIRQGQAELLELAIAIAEKVVSRVAESDIATAKANLEKALDLCCGMSEIAIHVNPAQLQALSEHCEVVVKALSLTGKISLLADDAISPGGVKVVTKSGQIDATIQTQLDNVAEALTGKVRGGQRKSIQADAGRYLSESSQLGESKSVARRKQCDAPSSQREHESS